VREVSFSYIIRVSIRRFLSRLPGYISISEPMGSRLKIQDHRFISELKNIALKVWRCTTWWMGGWAWSSTMQGYIIVLQGRLKALSRGPQHWLGPEGALRRCPVARAWLTALMTPAIVGQRDCSRAGIELQSACVTSKEFWFLSSGEGVKRRPLWETGSTPACLWISLRLPRVSSRCWRRTEGRRRGVDVVNFSSAKKKKKKAKGPTDPWD